MKRTRHSAEQIVNKLREADAMLAAGRSIAQTVQQLGVSEAGGRHRCGVPRHRPLWDDGGRTHRP